MDGKWRSEDVWKGFDANMTTLAPFNKVIPKTVADEVNALKDKIAAGKFHPLTGPIKKQDGKILVKKGAVLPDTDLLKMNVYVEGVEGELPR